MITIQHEVRIYRPLREVFAFAGDPTNDPQWISSVLESKPMSPGGPRAGMVFTQASKFLARRLDLTLVVETYEPDRVVRLRGADSPIPFTETRSFEPIDGDTRFTRLVEAEAGDFFRMADALVADAARRQAETDMYLLKVLLDARAEGDLGP